MTAERDPIRLTTVDFREDLERRIGDPEFAEAYEAAHDRAALGVRIAALRASKGLTQAELAARVNTTQSVISRYESADYESYRVGTLRRLAHALGGELKVAIELPEETPSR